ncbi:hypothetical protein QYS36_19050 [Pseudomonas sp. G34]|uniref:hypothetical protein n=1 Tax=Pseudomonas sp. G34 TaxID=3059083 RepID=UPI00280A1AC7|nr:hypothetical protein [Pseudomonas sp. G34]MDQ7987042.1 hypothetical protein [Pseudomonas sp. G34]
MQSAEKQCPFCAETIKAEAIRCKHCHADLTCAPSAPSAPAMPSGLGFFSKMLITVAIAGALYLGFGFYISNTPEGKEKIRARAAIDLCHDELAMYRGSIASADIIAGACRKLEDDFRQRFGHAP